MPHKRTTRFAYQTATCGLCRAVLDLPSGFWFDTETPLGLVHPSCMMYSCERGPVTAGDAITMTCGNDRCVRPDHLTLHHPPMPCTKRSDAWIVRPGYAIGCDAPADTEWVYDHFHALIDGIACSCIHETCQDARTAHGQSVEG